MKPSIPKGTRDFIPAEALKREYLFSKIESIFQKYAYVPIETPTMENLSTLTGKYGDEGDQLLFKVLNNGDFLSKADPKALAEKDSNALVHSISKRGLRYDLTVPFARFVVMHQNEISFPFKRYHIQPVWRADRPQKGRYQEFYQCDVDVVGSDSLSYEAELIQILDEVFNALNVQVKIRLNNRKILAGIAEVAGVEDKFMSMTISVDKLDKIGWDKVLIEMEKGGINEEQGQKIKSLFSIANNFNNNSELILEMKNALSKSEIGLKGISEIEQVFKYLEQQSNVNEVAFDPSLARGLSYYTGCIFEVNALDFEIGSMSGGGRYDDLTSVFGLKDVSGVGISFGAERIYDVMDGLNLFPENITEGPEVMCLAVDEESHYYGFDCVQKLRAGGIIADLYPEPKNLKKQMKYANQVNAVYVAILGETERNSGEITFKHMESGEQEKMRLAEFISKHSK